MDAARGLRGVLRREEMSASESVRRLSVICVSPGIRKKTARALEIESGRQQGIRVAHARPATGMLATLPARVIRVKRISGAT
jgi:hypothetical protein